MHTKHFFCICICITRHGQISIILTNCKRRNHENNNIIIGAYNKSVQQTADLNKNNYWYDISWWLYHNESIIWGLQNGCQEKYAHLGSEQNWTIFVYSATGGWKCVYLTNMVPVPSATLQPDIKNGFLWSLRTCITVLCERIYYQNLI